MFCEDIAPIPLTPEILIRNEFYFGNTSKEEDIAYHFGCSLPDKGWCYDEGGGSVKITFPNDSDGGELILDDQNNDKYLEMVFAENIYVHELQNFLNSLGINKEVIL